MMNEMSTWKEVGEGAAIIFRVIQMQIHDAFLRIVSPIRHMQTERAFRRLENLCDILKITQDQFVIVHVNSEIGKVRLQIEQLHTRCLQDAEEAEAAKNRIEAWMRRHEARKRMEAGS